MCQLSKIHRLECAQHAFLDHSKTLAFSDVIKINSFLILASSRHSLLLLSRQKNYVEQECTNIYDSAFDTFATENHS